MAYDPITETYGDWDEEDNVLLTVMQWGWLVFAGIFVAGIVHGFGQLLGFWK